MAHYSDLLNLRDQIRHTPNLITILKVFQKKKQFRVIQQVYSFKTSHTKLPVYRLSNTMCVGAHSGQIATSTPSIR